MNITLEAEVLEQINFAAVMSEDTIIRSLSLEGGEGVKVALRIYGMPEFIYEFRQEYALPEGRFTLDRPELVINQNFWKSNMIEAMDATLNIEVIDVAEDKLVTSLQRKVSLSPYLHWEAERHATLACFVQPNDPMVVRVLKRAGEIATQKGISMCGYQKDTAYQQACCIYQALSEEKIHYFCPPAPGQPLAGQKIRIPSMVLDEQVKQGTCVDLAVLYVSCLEAARLNPLLFTVEGHAFAGVWLEAAKFSRGECEDYEFLSGQMIREQDCATGAKEGICPVECTFMADDKKVTFESAVATALHTLKEDTFRYVLDLAKCRDEGYYPVFSIGEGETNDGEGAKPGRKAFRKLTRLEHLQRQALDLSENNPLLNVEGREGYYQLLLDEEEALFAPDLPGHQVFDMVRDRMLAEKMEPKEINSILLKLYREDQKARKDTGRGTAYFTIDGITWEHNEKQLTAPLYLVPVELYYSVGGEMSFTCDMTRCRINPALRELLRTEFMIDISELKDYPGECYREEKELLCQILGEKKICIFRDRVCRIGLFPMPNEAIYWRLSDEKLLEHEVVKGILDGKMSWKNSLEENPQEKTLYPLASDSSQRKVIRCAYDKKAQVVIGPAGSGKSQTIANMIADHMAAGKKLLFVAEKASAQQVVYEKLKDLGLDPYCLYLPEGKNHARDLRAMVDRTLMTISSRKEEKADQRALDLYEQDIQDLIAYHMARRQENEKGHSFFDNLERAEKYKNLASRLDLSGIDLENKEESARRLAENISTFWAKNAGRDCAFAWKLKGLDASEQERKQISDTVYRALRSAADVNEALTGLQLAMKIMFLDLDEEASKNRMLEYGKLLKRCPVVGPVLPYPAEEDLELLLRMAQIVTTASVNSEIYEENNEKLWNRLKELDEQAKAGKNYGDVDDIYSIPRLFPGRPPGMPLTQKEKKVIQDVAQYRKFEEEVLAFTQGRPKDERKEALYTARALGRGENDIVLSWISKLENALTQEEICHQKAQSMAFAVSCSPQEAQERYRQWLLLDGKWEEISVYYKIREDAVNAGLVSLFDRMENFLVSGGGKPEELEAALEKAIVEADLKNQMSSFPAFQGIYAQDYLCYLDKLSLKQQEAAKALQVQIRNAVAKDMPDLAEGVENDEELGILQKLIRHTTEKDTAHSFFEKAGKALMELYPCMIMGPYTAAECLTENMPLFDLVLFDEGSQLPTYKALYPISRSKGCLIVGDEKQMNPTSFFQKTFEDEEGLPVGNESILEDAIVTSMPQNMLKCHYRSRYESLMAFSNNRYYQGELVSFPGIDTEFMGVSCIYVEDGIYDRGGKRNNRKEAERVLELLQEIYEGLPEDTRETIGVITFNTEQKQLIETLICDAINNGVKTGRQLLDLVDVVNLEECQGKEWDISVLSTSYGRDKEGKFTNQFGPMGREEGRNRLNVMITRAKKAMYVVTSLTPDMISEDAKGGAKDIRDYLLYASGKLVLDTREVDVCGKNVGAIAGKVAERLVRAGYQVHFNIGASGCKVQIGVLDETGKSYRLGILLDDEEAAFDILDHEVLFPAMLQRGGWRIYRLFGENWYKNPEKEMQEIEKLLKDRDC